MVKPLIPAGPITTLHFASPADDEKYSVVMLDAANHRTQCALPCDANAASGTSLFTFSRDDGVSISGTAVVPTTPSRVSFHRRRRTQLLTGCVLSIAGLVLGFPLALDTSGGPEQHGGVSSTDLTLGVVGLGALIVGTTVMATSGADGVDVTSWNPPAEHAH